MNRQVLTALPFLLIGGAHAQALHAVRPLEGYQCMSLNVAPGAMLDPTKIVPLRAAPDPTAAVVGRASSVLIVQAPATHQNGFLEVTRPDHRTAWVSADYVRPWANPYALNARCVPSVMSNGSIGTASH